MLENAQFGKDEYWKFRNDLVVSEFDWELDN